MLGRRSASGLLVVMAAMVGSAHVAHLIHLERAFACPSLSAECPALIRVLETSDSGTYRRTAERIEAQGLLAVSYLKRTPGLPLAFLLAKRTGGRDHTILRWVPLLAAAAALSIGWIGWQISGRVGVGLAAGLLFGVWPSVYQLAPILMTDGMHGLLAVSALAATLWWRTSERPLAALLAAVLWAATQSLRHTFFALPVLLPLLLWRTRATRRGAAISLALWVSTWLVPGFVLVSNQAKHGRILAPQGCYAVPRLQDELGLGEFAEERERCKDEIRADPDAVVARERAFLLDHFWRAVWSHAREIQRQTFAPVLPFASRDLTGLYPTWTVWIAPVKLFWAAALCGLILLARRDPLLALFLAAAFAMVMIPAANVHKVGSRIRFPLDLFFIPLAVMAVWRGGELALRRRSSEAQ